MRHLRTRRRFRIIIAALLVVCIILFVEARIEAFAPQVKDFITLKAEEALGGKVKLSIGNVEGGILNPISFNEIKLKDKHDAAIFTSIVIDSIRTNYHVWDLLLKRVERSGISNILSRDTFVYVNFETKNRENSGFVRINGDLSDARVIGSLSLFNNEKVDFEGRITTEYFAFELKPIAGIVKIYGRISSSGDIIMNVRTECFKIHGISIACDLLMRNKITADPAVPTEKTLDSELLTRRIVVNGKTYPEIKATYRISKDVLDISRFEFGDNIKMSGKIILRDPYKVDIRILIDNLSCTRFFAIFGAQEIAKVFSGNLNAKIELKGPYKNPKSNISLEVRKGNLMMMDFDSLSVIFKGDGPLLRIDDSRIVRQSGSLVIAGEFDVRKIGKGILFDNLKLISDEKALTWDRFNTSKLNGTEEVNMQKKLSSDLNLGFKRYLNDERVGGSSRDKDEFQLKYKLNELDSLAMSVKDGGGFFGMEHRDSF